MSRPARYIVPATLLSISLVFTGCKTVYSDMYSPRRSHYIPVKPKPKAEPILPLIDTAPVPGTDILPALPPAAPPSEPPPVPAEGAAPMIPGL